METVTVWLNKNFSSTYNAIETLRAARQEETLRIVCSHTSEDFPALRLADVAEVEPRDVAEPAYLDYCLDMVKRHAVDVFIPGKMLRPVVRERRRFEEAGARLVAAADAATLEVLENKAALYAAVPAGLVPVPDYRVVSDLAGFDEAATWLRSRGHTVCFKPAVSLFGRGFHVLTENGTALERLLGGDAIRIAPREARLFLGQQPRFRDVLVMQYLPGPERSVDCLAHEGSLVRCVVRRKPATEGGQMLEDHPAVEEMARRLTAHFRLDGIFNVQFRDCDGRPYLLEINPRISGGLHYACLSGIAFPYWAVRLALGTARPEDVPRPQTGIRVGQVDRAIRL